jgi:endoglucanase
MKIINFKKSHLYRYILKIIIPMITTLAVQNAKSSPTLPAERQMAFNRAKTLDNGISISWLEQTWDTDVLKKPGIQPQDLTLLKTLGF